MMDIPCDIYMGKKLLMHRCFYNIFPHIGETITLEFDNGMITDYRVKDVQYMMYASGEIEIQIKVQYKV